MDCNVWLDGRVGANSYVKKLEDTKHQEVDNRNCTKRAKRFDRGKENKVIELVLF